MDRRLILSAIITLAAQPPIIATIAIILLWCVHQWNWPVGPLAVIGCGLLFGISYAVWRAARHITERPFKFTIRAMLIGVAVVAVLLGTICRWMLDTYRQQLAIRTMATYGGFRADYGQRDNWLHKWLGYDPFDDVTVLDIDSDQALSAFIKQVDQFAEIETVVFGPGVSPAALAQVRHLNQFPKLRVPNFIESSIDSQGLQHLRAWTNISGLFFNGCPNLTDAGLQHLVGLPNVEELSLIEEGGGMVITDAGLVHVGRMKDLRYLMLARLPQVTDAGLAHLHQLSKLENVVIRGTRVTSEGLKQLYKALPDCRVLTDVFVPGRAEIQRIAVWRIGRPDTMLNEIRDADQIGKIRELIKTCREQPQIDDRQLFEPRPASFRLEFIGATRVLYEVRLGNGEFQQSIKNRWIKWQISGVQEVDFMKLVRMHTSH